MSSVKKQSVISLVLLLVAIGISALLYLNRPDTAIAEPEPKLVSVDAAQVVKETLRIPVQAQGTVMPLRATSLQAEVSGKIIETAENFLVGGFIAKGDEILRIDSRDYRSRLLRTQAALKTAESNLAQEKGRAKVALNEWQSLPKNKQRSKDATDLYLRKPQLEQAKAQLLAAKADLDTARNDLDRTSIKAPYDALISAKHSELGQFVGAGTPLAEIFSIDRAEVRLPIPQSKLKYLDLPAGVETYKGDAKIKLYTDVAGDRMQWTATLHRTEGAFDERSRALYTVARVDDPYALNDEKGHALRMGSFVKATILGRELEGLISLPRYILRAGNQLWVIDKDNVLRNRQVTVLRTGGDRVYVSEGLEEGELVCLTMMDASFTGTAVTLQSTTLSNALWPSEQNDSAISAIDADVSDREETSFSEAAENDAKPEASATRESTDPPDAAERTEATAETKATAE